MRYVFSFFIFLLAAACHSAEPDGSVNVVARSGAIRLGSSPLAVPLTSVASPAKLDLTRKTLPVFKGHVCGGATRHHLSNLSGNRLAGAAGCSPLRRHDQFFFSAVPLPGAMPKTDQPIELDVTALAAKLLNGKLSVLVVPEGVPGTSATPEIKSIDLIVQ
jgi:hypothetical protein